MISSEEAQQALDSARAARRKAEDYDLPFGFHLVFAVILGGFLAVQGLPTPWKLAGIFALCALLGGMVHWLMLRYGRWVNGWRRGRTRIFAILMVGTYLTLLGFSMPLIHGDHPPLSPFAAGAIMFAIAVPLDILWVRALKAEWEAGR